LPEPFCGLWAGSIARSPFVSVSNAAMWRHSPFCSRPIFVAAALSRGFCALMARAIGLARGAPGAQLSLGGHVPAAADPACHPAPRAACRRRGRCSPGSAPIFPGP
jgi:hypothetical protein